MKIKELFPDIETDNETYKLDEIPHDYKAFIDQSVEKIQAKLKEKFPRKRTLHKIAQVITYRYLIWPGCGVTLPPVGKAKNTQLELTNLVRQSKLDGMKFWAEYHEYCEAISLPNIFSFMEDISSGWIWMKGIYDNGNE